MADDLRDSRAERGGNIARRLVEANRGSFDSALPPPGAADRRVQALEAALAAARAEASALQAWVHAIQVSTSWRLTRPVRWAIDAIRPPRQAEPSAMAAEPPSFICAPDYQQWIATEEAGCLASLACGGPGHRSLDRPRLGLVLLATADHDPAWTTLLSASPPDYSILVLDQQAGLPAIRHSRITQHPVAADFLPEAAFGVALARLDTDMLGFLDARDQLAPHALSLMANALAQQPDLDLVFGDEDWLDAAGRRVQPFFKPGWDPELQRGRDLVGPFALYRTALLRNLAAPSGPDWRAALANQVAAATRPERIRHIPAVLGHRRPAAPHAGTTAASSAAQLRQDGLLAQVRAVPGHADWRRVAYDLPQPEPLVSIIVPTRDRAELLGACADGLLNHTAYRALELLIVDNGTTEPDAVALIDRLAADSRVRVLRHPGAFNWSALNNAAAARASGDVLVLLNNDIVVLQPDWLTVLVSHAVQPGVGAVGAKLLYPDGRVQHAGLTTDQTGVPRHLFRYAAGDDPGPCGLLGLAREVWGVTGACLAMLRRVFFEVGGLNEMLPIAYNDVDLCLRLTAHGYRIVWTPWSVLQHREMASRPADHTEGRREQAREELDRLVRDWGCLVLHDPFLNANFELVDEQLCFRRAAPPAAPP